MRQKLAFVANTSWSVYNFRLEVAKHMQSQGCEIYVIAPRDKHSEKLIAEGFHFINAPIKAYSNNPIIDFRYFLFLFKTYRKHQFSHIFHYTIKPNIYGSIAAKLAACKNTMVVTGMGRLVTMRSRILMTITENLYRIGCSCADHTWFLNEEDKSHFEHQGLVGPGQSSILPSEGINLDHYSARTNQEEKVSTHFLFAGRLIIEKGIIEYLQAAERVVQHFPLARFEIIGFLDPYDQSSIPSEILFDYQNKGIIEFYGDRENVIPYLAKADCIVLPSYYGEGISRVLLEAAAMKKAIITTNNLGCKELINDVFNGFVCLARDVQSLSDQMMSMITLDSEARKVMGENGRKMIKEKFDVRKICWAYEKHIYSQIALNTSEKQKVI